MIERKSYAKVNIFLKIAGKRENYHEIVSRFVLVDNLYDVVRFEKEFHAFIESKYSTLITDLKAKQKIDDDIKEVLETAINEFKTIFKAD